MENRFRRQTPRLTDANVQKGSGRGSSNPAERADQISIESQVASIEDQILSHASLAAHLDVVNVYLTIGKYQLEPISWLRQEGLWRTQDPMTMHEMSLRLPQRDHYEALRDVQPSLFDSPPSDLFDLICQYRWFTNFQQTDITAKLEEAALTSEQRPTAKYEAGRTAPDGHKYPCPSRGCKKDYQKSGHLRNHINQNHPDFLRLHPEWKPYYRPVDAAGSDSSSPAEERHSTQRLEEIRPPRSRQSVSTEWSYAGETADLVPGSPMILEYADEFEPVPSARSDRETFSHARVYRERASQPQRSRHSSFSVDRGRLGSRRSGLHETYRQPNEEDTQANIRAYRRHSSRQRPQFAKDQYGSER